uniref:Predicted protein n=1 Tax=Hordeum vulgare subsp. vulgare TaxID=112509 RepID=F2DR90_HORVV|nr:predicted protein [Hordeum vulgare subsp. vulgare]
MMHYCCHILAVTICWSNIRSQSHALLSGCHCCIYCFLCLCKYFKIPFLSLVSNIVFYFGMKSLASAKMIDTNLANKVSIEGKELSPVSSSLIQVYYVCDFFYDFSC